MAQYPYEGYDLNDESLRREAQAYVLATSKSVRDAHEAVQIGLRSFRQWKQRNKIESESMKKRLDHPSKDNANG